MPIHLRAEPGAYAEACLLPGDPLRARAIAEQFLSDAKLVNEERGLLGFTGTFEGQLVSIHATGMGGPSTAIVVEELIRLGVQRLLRVGTCGALQPELKLGELVLALSAVPADGASLAYLGGEPHAPTADWELLHGVVHAAKARGATLRVGPVVSTDLFYDPEPERYRRWSDRGALAIEMEAAALFTIAALRKAHAGCLLTVSDVALAGVPKRIEDVELRGAVERMAELALHALVARSK